MWGAFFQDFTHSKVEAVDSDSVIDFQVIIVIVCLFDDKIYRLVLIFHQIHSPRFVNSPDKARRGSLLLWCGEPLPENSHSNDYIRKVIIPASHRHDSRKLFENSLEIGCIRGIFCKTFNPA